MQLTRDLLVQNVERLNLKRYSRSLRLSEVERQRSAKRALRELYHQGAVCPKTLVQYQTSVTHVQGEKNETYLWSCAVTPIGSFFGN